jgi:mannose-1-phosphate guanylyltransferase
LLQAIILVGGEGTRLRPLTYGTPKPMVPILGMPFLEYTLSRLKHAGIDDVILAAGYLPAAITRPFGDGSRLGMKLTYVIEKEPLGTAGALRNVAEHIRSTFFVLNGDVLTSLDLRAMLAEHRARKGLGLIHLIRAEDPSAFGCVVHDEHGLVSQFVEKPPRELAPTNEVNAGTYLLEREVLDLIPEGRNVSIERETFPILVKNRGLYAHTTDDCWIDLGRPEHYLQAHRDVLDARLTLDPPADPTAYPGRLWLRGSAAKIGVELPIYVAESAFIEPGAHVGPHAVLGARTHVRVRASVRDSILWDGVVIGEGAVVEGAILASNVVVGPGARIEPGAVIGHDTVVDAGMIVPAHARIPAPS